jgi:hypothetical protein
MAIVLDMAGMTAVAATHQTAQEVLASRIAQGPLAVLGQPRLSGGELAGRDERGDGDGDPFRTGSFAL